MPNFRVLHSIPGRIRLQVPLWKHVPREWQLDLPAVMPADCLPGIHEIRLNSVTGTALITYDTNEVSERQILDMLDELASLIRRHRRQLSEYSPEQRDEMLAYMRRVIQAHWAWLRGEAANSPS